MKRYSSILTAIQDTIWLAHEPKVREICNVLELKAAGFSVDAATVEKVAAENRQGRTAVVTRSVAVLPLLGTICHRMDLMSDFSGGTSCERFGREFDRLIADDEVGAILIDVESPGGCVYGIPETAEKVFAARGKKPIVAIANSYAFSGGYWIAAACDELVVTPSGEVGSVGVVAVHEDCSKANELAGVKFSYAAVPKYKAELNPDTPLSEESHAYLIERANTIYDTFTKSLAKFRGIKQQKVRADFGEGRTVFAQDAVDRGMADRVDTFEATIARLSGAKRPKGSGSKVAAMERRLALQK